jgi:hypothetical protein
LAIRDEENTLTTPVGLSGTSLESVQGVRKGLAANLDLA